MSWHCQAKVAFAAILRVTLCPPWWMARVSPLIISTIMLLPNTAVSQYLYQCLFGFLIRYSARIGRKDRLICCNHGYGCIQSHTPTHPTTHTHTHTHTQTHKKHAGESYHRILTSKCMVLTMFKGTRPLMGISFCLWLSGIFAATLLNVYKLTRLLTHTLCCL